ncbi:nitrogen regulatory protein P-II [Desulfonatronospira thiodismutans ASO3-1]|uniref:Nitrogen regulatory protein P-II n=1 Tax=Desulfonatronospira thiodismutans ASO3-1 TaxID=555779 RepID=D6SLD4_9BACT|nr:MULTISPECIES: P-II family nitrogen regulator [Desulfonatronospira]EFI35495.1 nitrogen regulatory protein P-II [Desulfonatronospira thiodismutans ASO3-1]RQD77614.1 MAG: P-II family nitrogen regulator [Desulfonatronospira sp. MSAO_Bac3]
MKEVMAIIRANKINQTKKALVAAGLPSFTAVKCMGRGSRPVDFEMLEAMNRSPEDAGEILPILSQGGRLIPKRMLSLIVPPQKVQEVVDIIMQENSTGNQGDGKVFVLPISDVLRVRTEEEGLQAIDEMQQ